MSGGGGTLKAPAFTLAEGATHVVMLNSQRRFGFTLAEVLVTLGIIGVVSAMTVPSLMQNYQKQSYVTQLHKVYNELSQSLVRYQTDKNAVNLREAGLNNHDALSDFVKSTFKVVKECGNKGSDCFAVGEYKRMNGESLGIFNYGKNQYVLASGTAIYAFASGGGIVTIYIDTNGKKGPNIIGRDVFATRIYNNGIMDDCACPELTSAPLTQEQRETSFEDHCVAGKEGCWWGCLGKIINDNWQMTY